MQPYWWGILGLIGWSYLIASIVFLFWGHSCTLIAASWMFLALFNVAEFAGLLDVLSKIRATPSWTEICTGIGILSFALLYWIIDLKDNRQWWSIIRPAGTATLTCYLVPYIYYAIMGSLGLALPGLLSSGILGLVKSMLYALMIVWITGQLGRANIN